MAAIFNKYFIAIVFFVPLIFGCQNINDVGGGYLRDDCRYFFSDADVKKIIDAGMKNDEGNSIISDELGVYKIGRSHCNYFIDFVFVPYEPGGVMSFVVDRAGNIISIKIGR